MSTSLLYYQGSNIVEKEVKAIGDNIGLDDFGSSVTGFVQWYANNSQLLPTWWTRSREGALRRAAVENDMLSIVIFNLVMMLNRMPLVVRPRDTTITAHAKMAEVSNLVLQNSWQKVSEMFIWDMLVHDMGAFLLIESEGSVSAPVSSAAAGLKHLPASRVTVTSSAEFPIFYRTLQNKTVRVHESRLIRLTQMPIALDENFMIGLSFVSRAMNVAELMRSVNQYQLELLGSLESDQLIYATDTNSKSLKRVFQEAEMDSVNQGRIRAGRRVYLGMRDPSAKIGSVNLKGGGQSFNTNEYVNSTIKLLAFAAGVDVNQLVNMDTAGSTKSAALISDLKSRFKLASWFANKLKGELERKFLPHALVIEIGDTKTNVSETQAKTMINVARAEKLMIETDTIDTRIARENALRNGFITESQMMYMELQDFRLPGGLPVRTLFFKNDIATQQMLEISGFTDPCDIDGNDAETILPLIKEKICEVEEIAINAKTASRNKTAQFALSALTWLQEEYESAIAQVQFEQEIESAPQVEAEVNIEDEEIFATNVTLTEDNPNQQKRKKKHKAFIETTSHGRKAYRPLKQHVRQVWKGELEVSDLFDTIVGLINEHPKLDEDDREDILYEIESEFDEFAEFLSEHTKDAGAKISQVLTKLDEFINNT